MAFIGEDYLYIDETLTGTSGGDEFALYEEGEGKNRIFGEGGDDYIGFLGLSPSAVYGGEGADTFYFSSLGVIGDPYSKPTLIMDLEPKDTIEIGFQGSPNNNITNGEYSQNSPTEYELNLVNLTEFDAIAAEVNGDNSWDYFISLNNTKLESSNFTSQVSQSEDGTYLLSLSRQNKTDNQKPTAQDDSATTTAGQAVTIDVIANDSDPDGDSLSLDGVTEPAHGQATVDNGQVQYTPDANFTGEESFSYTVADGQGGTAEGNITITVETPPDEAAPTVGADQSLTLEENVAADAVLGAISASDNDGGTGVASYAIASGEAQDWVAIDDQGQLTLTEAGAGSALNDYETGANEFAVDVTATDGAGNTSDPQTVTLQTQDLADGGEPPTTDPPTVDPNANVILQGTGSSHTVAGASESALFATEGADTITLQEGATADISGFQGGGDNELVFQEPASAFSVQSSGSMVYFQSANDTTAAVAVGPQADTVAFSDQEMDLAYDADRGGIFLGEREIKNEPLSLADGSATETPELALDIEDPAGTYASYHDAIRETFQAAWSEMMGWLDPAEAAEDASIELDVDFDVSNTTNTLVQSGSAWRTPPVVETTPSGHDVAYTDPIREIRTGTDPNGSQADAEATFRTAPSEFAFRTERSEPVPSDQTDGLTVLEHELFHVLGWSSGRDASGTPSGDLINTYDRHVEGDGVTGFTFQGPEAVAANGGQPLDLGTEDPSHLATNDPLMGPAIGPGQSKTATEPEIQALNDMGLPIDNAAVDTFIG